MPAPSLIDTIVGGCYRLTRPLGEGGMGVVYEALHLRLGGKVAVKILSPQHAADSKFRERFRREARSASQIRHPNVVQITDFGDTPNGSVFFTMELLEGRDLHHLLRAHAPAPFPWRRAQHLLAQATDALAAAHRSGIIHRDVKPSNIFVLEGPGLQDFVKLLDFGIAKIVAPSATADSALVKNLTGTGEIFGTAKYMAPEQAYGGSNDPRMDVYSLGVVAYELLTGRVPFTGQSNFEIITRHVYGSPQPLRELRPELPAALEAVVLRAMQKKPEDRFATMEEFGQALRRIDGAAARAGTNGSAVPRARTHADTDAETVAGSRRKDLLPSDPIAVQRPMQAATVPQAPPEVRVLGPAAPVIRKTVPAIAAASLPVQLASQAVPASMPPAVHSHAPPLAAAPLSAAPPRMHPVAAAPSAAAPVMHLAAAAPSAAAPGMHLAAAAPGMHPPASPPAASPTDSLARVQAPTGPLARHHDPAYDDTGRDLAMRPPAASSGTGRLVALALVGALVVASSSAVAVVLALGSDEQEPASAQAAAPAPESPSESPESSIEPAPGPIAVAPSAGLASHLATNEPGVADEEPPEVVSPAPDPVVTAPPAVSPSPSDAKQLPSKTPSSKRRPTTPTAPDPDRERAKQIGREIRKKIKRDCWKLGTGREVYIRLQIGSDGRVVDKTIAAIGLLRACIEKNIGVPQFPAKRQPIELSLVIGDCVEAYGSTVAKCK